MGGEIGGEIRALRSSTVFAPAASAAEAAETGALATVGRRLAGVFGVFLTLAALGFGLVMFGRPNLEVVSDTVSHSFGRAFVTGLLGQILVIPTFGMLIVGLILSVAGILLLPFAVAVYGLLVVVAALGGFLAVAHAMGETYIRRRMAMGVVIGSANSYRYLRGRSRRARRAVAGLVGVRLGAGGGQPHPRRRVPRHLAARHRGLRRRAAQPRRNPGELRRPADPAGGAHRRVPLGHPAVRRSGGTATRRPDTHARALMRGVAMACRSPSRSGRGARPLRACGRSAPSASSTARPGCRPSLHYLAGGLRVAPGRADELYRMDASYDEERYRPTSDFDAATGAVALGARSRPARAGSGCVSDAAAPAGRQRRLLARRWTSTSTSPSARWTPTWSWAGSACRRSPCRRAPARRWSASPSRTARAAAPPAITAGAAELTMLGLGNSRCDRIDFEGGMGKVTLDFGGTWTSSSQAAIKMAVGELTLRLPRRVGVRLTLDRFLAQLRSGGTGPERQRASSRPGTIAPSGSSTSSVTTAIGGVRIEWADEKARSTLSREPGRLLACLPSRPWASP